MHVGRIRNGGDRRNRDTQYAHVLDTAHVPMMLQCVGMDPTRYIGFSSVVFIYSIVPSERPNEMRDRVDRDEPCFETFA